MIPLKYRQKLPPYWYENQVAEFYFEATAEEMDHQIEKSKDLSNQFLLPYATWGLDIWDWMYFGDKQLGTYQQRRENVRGKILSKAKFTLGTLEKLGQNAGKLESIQEDFENKAIRYRFDVSQPVQLEILTQAFSTIRPVHVKEVLYELGNYADPITIEPRSKVSEIEYPACNAYFAGDISAKATGVPVFLSTGQVIYVV